MQKIFEEYIQSISRKFSHEETSEMGYRTDFEILLKGIFESINVSRFDHDARAKQGNKPDFVVLKNDVPILYIETKDIGISLDKIEKSEQMSRYFGYANLILTDYVEFRFYRNGLPYGEPIKIAEYAPKDRTITPLSSNFENLTHSFIDFTQSHKEPIKSGKHLSKIMGGKAQRIRDNVRQFLITQTEKNAELVRVYETIKKLLVHDLTEDAFADMYAQTLVYGLFVARFYDESPTNFTRQEARDLIPKSNPLLRQFFDHIVGPNFDKRLEYIVNELCEVFSHADVEKLMNEYLETNLKSKTHRRQDTVIHFYEDFLNEYDPVLRRKMGAYYTPLPVVEFIVKAVDHLLQKEFGLSQGLADTSKLPNGKHRVQVLDPAVGTGTFISAVIGEIYRKLKGQEGRWPAYVLHDLLPRIHGFELMIAPYTIAHLKLGMAFKETGFKYFNNRRLGIYLTNSLEKTPSQEDLFTAFGLAESIAQESKEAAVVKNTTPIMVVLGNPPYSGVSSNETEDANRLVEKYKVEPGGRQKLQERKHWLNDDYVKFIALAESMIEKNEEGIVAMITNHGYIENPTFRGMRWHLRKTFDLIYVLDLHGNSNKKETSPDRSKDENVFDIKTGVSIILAVKKGKRIKDLPAQVLKADLFGLREDKFARLDNETISEINWTELPLETELWVLEGKGKLEYLKGFSVAEMFPKNTTGIVTAIDSLSIFSTKEELEKTTQSILNSNDPYREFNIKDGRKYKKEERLEELREASANEPTKISYRPFDTRYMYYTQKSECWINSPRSEVMRHLVGKKNIALLSTKQTREDPGVFITSSIAGHKSFSAYDITSVFPLYLYTDDGTRVPNITKTIIFDIEKIVGKTMPEDIFDYIYAVLHWPKYREQYKEFLKIDFPRVPYPTDKKQFERLVALGGELREIHLFEAPKVNEFITTYPVSGSDTVEKISYKNSNVYINFEQYFGNVPHVAWNFYIGGYQPAQRWLKDRKGKTLTNEDIEHYQKIIIILIETDRLMNEIDKL